MDKEFQVEYKGKKYDCLLREGKVWIFKPNKTGEKICVNQRDSHIDNMEEAKEAALMILRNSGVF